jgi:hypothetical protein
MINNYYKDNIPFTGRNRVALKPICVKVMNVLDISVLSQCEVIFLW